MLKYIYLHFKNGLWLPLEWFDVELAWQDSFVKVPLLKMTSTTKATNPQNRWPLLLGGNERDICQGPENQNTF